MLRRTFWNLITILKFRTNRRRKVPVPVAEGRRIRPIPLRERYPAIPIDDILVADHVPPDEARRLPLAFCRFQPTLTRVFSPMQAGMPPVPADPHEAIDTAYTRGHRRLLPAPVIPDEYQGQVDLGQLAVAGPYSYYLHAVDGGGYEWDLRHLGEYEHHRGLRSLGVRVSFEADEHRRRVSATEIDCELGVCTPGDPQWGLAQRLALCAATNHLSLVRHFDWVHLATVSHVAVATRNQLPADHPLRRLLWPHVWGTQYSNELVTEVLLGRYGDFASVFSFTHPGLCRLFEDSYHRYDIAIYDPEADLQRRGLVAAPFDQPAWANRMAHFDVMLDHAQRYLGIYYRSDAELQDDADVAAWVEALNRMVPNGVGRVLGAEPTLHGLARLVAVLAYVGTVEHEVMGTGLWNYQVWTHVQPVRVRRDGQRDPVDVYQRLVNYNFLLNVRRAQLLDDYSYLALDAEGAAAFRRFRSDLRDLEERVAKEEHAWWRVRPSILEVSVNG